MPAIARDLIDQAIENADVDLHVHEAYSGKRMYGAVCLGLSGNSSDYATFMIELALLNHDVARELAHGALSDSLGLGTVYYFPNFTLQEEQP